MPKPPPDPSRLIDALPAVLQPLARRAAIVRFARHELLIREGDLGDTIYIVLEGRVHAYSADDRGHEVTFGIYGAGEYVGEMSLDGGRRSASVRALAPTCCAMVTRHTLKQHIAADPELAFELLGKVIRRARLATQSARNLALLKAHERLGRLLDSLAPPADGPDSRTVPPQTHADLASQVGCTRAMVSRLLQALERDGYLRREPQRWVLPRALPASW